MTESTDQKDIHILLLEDNDVDYLYTKSLVTDINTSRQEEQEQASFKLTRSPSFASAITQLSQDKFDLILLDLSLPDAHGLDTFYTMRTVSPHVPIIVLTGNQDEEAALHAVEAGAQDYLVKGHIDANVLSRSVRYAIQRFRIIEQLESVKQESKRITREKNELTTGIDPDLRALTARIVQSTKSLYHSHPQTIKVATLSELHESTLFLSSIVESLLDLPALEAGEMVLNKEPVSFADLLAEICSTICAFTRRRDLEIVSSVKETVPKSLVGDTARLKQVLTYLLQVTSGIVPDRAKIEISIDNAGACTGGFNIAGAVILPITNLSLEQQTLFFESFVQASQAVVQKFGAYGLLLLVATRLIAAMEGKAWVRNVPGQNAEVHFVVRLGV